MAKKLATHVHVRDDKGTVHIFGPDSKVPDWAVAKITNPKAWEGGKAPEAKSDSPYADLKVDELRAEIDERNAERDEADLIPDDGKKADLVAALELDDES